MLTDEREHQEDVISLDGVAFEYGSKIRALEDVTFSIKPGGITALLGANGSGKSTILGILSGCLAPTEGVARVLGLSQSFHKDPRWRSRVSYAEQDLALDPEMTGEETLQLLGVLNGLPREKRTVLLQDLARKFDVESILPGLIRTYSGGQKRRLHVMVALIQNPALLLLDEPTVGLDMDARGVLWDELKTRSILGCSIVVATHDLSGVEALADHVLLMESGRVIASGSPRELMNGKSLSSVYRELTGLDLVGGEKKRGRRKR